ncbi:MAG: ABC transporter permease [Anaerolineae bacterium]|jgi:ABC-2 type transport system permease protein|nr:ABC transporter permease [Anaerolineae bacterium]
MRGAIFVELLRRNWRQMVYWGIGLAILGFYATSVIPNADTLRQYQAVVETLPPILLQAFGAADNSVMATPEGFVAFSFLAYLLLIMLVYAVLAGLNITASEEEDGIMDVLLALSVPRWRIIVEKYAVYALLVVGIVVISYAGMFLGAAGATMPFNMSLLTVGGINIVLGVLLVMAFTACLATLIRRRATTTAIVVSVIVVSYFINVIGNAAAGTVAAALRALSFFSYADAQYVVADGFSIGSVLLLSAATVLFFVGALWGWERRDVGV